MKKPATAWRERQKKATCGEIKNVALRQMAEQGPGSLSLRAIAGEMGLNVTSLYNYFKSRDELVTALIVDAYNSLGESLQSARRSDAQADPAKSLWAVLLAYREWAIAHWAEYVLIFGTPIPGYQAPLEVTAPALKQAATVLEDAMLDVHEKYPLKMPEYAHASTLFLSQLKIWQERTAATRPVAAEVVYAVLFCWTHLQGLVTLELFGHLRFAFTDPSEFYRLEMLALFERLGLELLT